MKAAILNGLNQKPILVECDRPSPANFEVLVRVDACALCRTDLHVLDGDLSSPKYPLVLGHEIVGIIEEVGERVENLQVGDRVGVPWLASTCLKCDYCVSGKENLCDSAKFTGYTVDGGFAEYTIADARFCFSIPDSYDSVHAAPLLCAGLIGWRSLRFTGDASRIGIYGFGAAAHVITPVALSEGRKFCVHIARRQSTPSLRYGTWMLLGRWLRRKRSRRTRCGNHFRLCRFSRANSPQSHSERRHCGVWRNSHDRYSVFRL